MKLARENPAQGIGLFGRSETQEVVSIQLYACVVAVSHNWVIKAVSGNCLELLGYDPQKIMGKPLSRVFSKTSAHRLFSLTRFLSVEQPSLRVESIAVPSVENASDLTLTRIGSEFVLEFERPLETPNGAFELEQIQRQMTRLSDVDDPARLATMMSSALRDLTGASRVSLHPFSSTGFAAALGIAGRHPLAQAPTEKSLEAHALQFSGQIQWLYDLEQANEVTLEFPGDEPGLQVLGPPPICSLAPFASARKALQLEGVRSATVLPLRVSGNLWGAFLCHCREPMMLSLRQRSTLALFGQMAAGMIEGLAGKQVRRAREEVRQLEQGLASAHLDKEPEGEAIWEHRGAINEILPHDGVALWHNGRFRVEGLTLPDQELEPLYSHVFNRPGRSAVTVQRLSDIAVSSRDLDPRTVAVMVLPFARQGTDSLILFRHVDRETGPVLAWQDWETSVGEMLRTALVESRLSRAEAPRETTRAPQERTTLVAELDHRVRNTFAQILSLVHNAALEEGFAATSAELESRVRTLIRVYDRLSEKDFAWQAFVPLLQDTFGRHLDPADNRVEIAGGNLILSPTAYSTLALVLHELFQHSKTQGALAALRGKVKLNVGMQFDGSAVLKWTEMGARRIRAPHAPGLGMSLVEKSVEFELQGQTKLRFGHSGLEARIVIPPAHVGPDRSNAEPTSIQVDDTPWQNDIHIDGEALVLDDNFILSLDLSQRLRELGAERVYVPNSVQAAFDALDRGSVSFALLDVNLGSETSLAVAEQLWNDGIPAALVTGYGEGDLLLDEFPPLPVLVKPFDLEDIRSVLRDCQTD